MVMVLTYVEYGAYNGFEILEFKKLEGNSINK